ncbi:MAG: hypothetical protein ACJ77N_06790 [Chloroflexota bacterium]
MPRYTARAEFSREERSAEWRLTGVWLAGQFWPAPDAANSPGRRRGRPHPEVGWTPLPTPIVGPDVETAASIALEIAVTTWPDRISRR